MLVNMWITQERAPEDTDLLQLKLKDFHALPSLLGAGGGSL